MSGTLWIVLIITVVAGVIIFKKTVANDAKNEFRLRDVLSQEDDDTESLSEEATISYSTYMQKEELNSDFKTEIHDTFEEQREEQWEEQSKNSKVFEEEKAEPKFDKNINSEPNYSEKIYKKKTNPFVFVKTFWRGITFAFGALIILYSFYGITAQAQNSMDVIIYSLWLIAGIILVK